jgi:uncharacterized iron-regulated membrane protein
MDYNPAMRALLVVALVLLLPPLPAWAGPDGGTRPRVVLAEAESGGLTLEQAVQRAEKRYKARAVKAEERSEGDRRVYRIRLLSEDGRVFEVTVDAATGRME